MVNADAPHCQNSPRFVRGPPSVSLYLPRRSLVCLLLSSIVRATLESEPIQTGRDRQTGRTMLESILYCHSCVAHMYACMYVQLRASRASPHYVITRKFWRNEYGFGQWNIFVVLWFLKKNFFIDCVTSLATHVENCNISSIFSLSTFKCNTKRYAVQLLQ